MGTYGTTHIKKGTKTIDLTDSHDGYFSAMGLSNLMSIKYINDKTLDKLVNLFNDFEYKDYDEFEITQRQIEDVIFQVEQDNPAASSWIRQAFSDDVRPSVTGFGPILYLQVNVSYNDSSSAQYIVDMDKKEFQYTYYDEPPLFTLSFAKIRKAPESLLNYLGNTVGSNFELVEGSRYEELENEYQTLLYQDCRTPAQDKQLVKIQKEIQKEIDAVFNIPLEKIEAYDKKQEAERLAYMAQHAQRMKEFDEDIEDDKSGGFSIRSANEVSVHQIRKVVTYLQKYMAQHPEASFLEKTSEWGLNETASAGGFRIFSPPLRSQDKYYEEVIRTLEYGFKIGMNGFSSSGTYSTNSPDEDSVGLFDDIPGPVQSIFTLDALRAQEPGWADAIKECDSSLVFHGYYKEARSVVLSGDLGHPNYSINWLHAALLNQDDEVLAKVYPVAQKIYQALPEETQKLAAPAILKSIADAEQINQVLSLPNNPQFSKALRDCGLLDDMKPYMSKKELSVYYPVKTKKLK